MITLVAFSVPIYDLFCRVTGFGGKTNTSEFSSNTILERDINLKFNADVNDSINWSFKAPEKINRIAIETSSDLMKLLIGEDVNNSSISAIVEDLSKKNKLKYYGN